MSIWGTWKCNFLNTWATVAFLRNLCPTEFADDIWPLEILNSLENMYKDVCEILDWSWLHCHVKSACDACHRYRTHDLVTSTRVVFSVLIRGPVSAKCVVHSELFTATPWTQFREEPSGVSCPLLTSHDMLAHRTFRYEGIAIASLRFACDNFGCSPWLLGVVEWEYSPPWWWRQ